MQIITTLLKQHDQVDIHTDLSKAFDAIDHTILMSKLQNIILAGKLLALSKSHISN